MTDDGASFLSEEGLGYGGNIRQLPLGHGRAATHTFAGRKVGGPRADLGGSAASEDGMLSFAAPRAFQPDHAKRTFSAEARQHQPQRLLWAII